MSIELNHIGNQVALAKKKILYKKQILEVIGKLKILLSTEDQDYMNTYIFKIITNSFHTGYLPQLDVPIVVEVLCENLIYNRIPKNDQEIDNRNWAKNLQPLVEFKEDKCSICSNRLHSQGKYPEGFPDIWKLCCKHLEVLRVGLQDLSMTRDPLINQKEWERNKQKYESFFTIKMDEI